MERVRHRRTLPCPDVRARGPRRPGALRPVERRAGVLRVSRRLPTEAEWERAAAGALPEHRRFPWGETAEGATADRTPEGVLALGGGVAEWVQDRGVFYPALPREPRDAGLDGGDAASEPDATSFSDEPEVATDAAATDAPERLESGLYVLNDPRGDDARSVWRVVRGGDGRVPVEARTTTMRRFRAPTDALPWVGLRCAYAH